jgi:hypothetical protein
MCCDRDRNLLRFLSVLSLLNRITINLNNAELFVLLVANKDLRVRYKEIEFPQAFFLLWSSRSQKIN